MYPRRQLPHSHALPGLPGQVGPGMGVAAGTSGPGLTRQAPLEWLADLGLLLGKTDPLSQGPFHSLSLSFSPSICVSFHYSSPPCLCMPLCVHPLLLLAKLFWVSGT